MSADLAYIRNRLEQEIESTKSLVERMDKEGRLVSLIEARARRHTLEMVKVWFQLAQKVAPTPANDADADLIDGVIDGSVGG